MFDIYYVAVIFVSLMAAFFSGLLGIGGGIVIFPSFLYILPLLGFEVLSVAYITGVSATQSLAGIFFSFLNHRKSEYIDFNIVKSVLPAGITGGIIGSVSAKFIPEQILLVLYLVILVMSLVLIFIPKEDYSQKNNQNINVKSQNLELKNFLIFFGAALSGSLGFAGAVTFIPVFIYFYRLPVKTAINTTISVVLIITSFIFIGKVVVGLVEFDLILFILIGAIVGAFLGSKLHEILSPLFLRNTLVVLVVLTGIRVLITILQQ